jgi:hypothetical protein
MRRLCPPAAATSSARFAVSCPLMSFKSGIASSRAQAWERVGARSEAP